MSTISERTNLPKVLLVEDTAGEANLMKLAFRRSPLPTHVTVAVSAEIALAMLKREGPYSGLYLPDLILMDLHLPKMHGLQLLSQIKANSTLRTIPVIVLSGSDTQSDIESAYGDYANGFIVKPISLDDYENLVQVIEEYWFGLMQTVPNDKAGVGVVEAVSVIAKAV